ncbi:MAG: TauD/TfdA family dioxygenase [Actinomycetota bacterium]|nr:TauD/TfdA family dioxygenase [Actinomycetota bacterium]
MAVCGQQAHEGGSTRLIDGRTVLDDLAATCPDVLGALKQPRSARFSDHLGAVLTDIPEPGTRPARQILRLRFDDLATFAPGLLALVPELQAAIERQSLTITLARGQGYLLDNHRWLHARNAFTGSRTMYRLHGNPVPGFGLRPGIPTADRP